MAGYKEEDLKQEVIPQEDFKPEEGVDVTRTPEKMAQDLASVSEEPVDVKEKIKELKEAEEKQDDNMLGEQS